MYKIKRITYINHPILKNLSLDFCDRSGHAVDTVIIAGENGTGKSTILDSIYKVVSRTIDFEAIVDFEKNDSSFTIEYRNRDINGYNYIFANDRSGMNKIANSKDVFSKYPTNGIFSDVEINFHAENLTSVTSMKLDEINESRRSSNDLPRQIKQLLIDIQALDDAELARTYRDAKVRCEPIDNLIFNERMPRFTTAFNKMFDRLVYSRIENTAGHKSIIFQKNGVDVSIDSLSSGEKQIVYRGCFLLKDANAINGAFVFIDEPEISLHPKWQKKIMEYYRGIFTNKDGLQTSQIITATHSPFIIHNEKSQE